MVWLVRDSCEPRTAEPDIFLSAITAAFGTPDSGDVVVVARDTGEVIERFFLTLKGMALPRVRLDLDLLSSPPLRAHLHRTRRMQESFMQSICTEKEAKDAPLL